MNKFDEVFNDKIKIYEAVGVAPTESGSPSNAISGAKPAVTAPDIKPNVKPNPPTAGQTKLPQQVDAFGKWLDENKNNPNAIAEVVKNISQLPDQGPYLAFYQALQKNPTFKNSTIDSVGTYAKNALLDIPKKIFTGDQYNTG